MTLAHSAVWIRTAWRATSRTDLVLAALVTVVAVLFGPHGGYLFVTFHEGVDPILDPDKNYLKAVLETFTLVGLPLVFGVRLADQAIADGAPRWLAYLLTLLAVGACKHLYNLVPLPWQASDSIFPGAIAWNYLSVLFDGGIGLVIYARWRAAQRSMRLVQASETGRARSAQRLQSARLLALQARVDPQLLFDTLGRVGELQRVDQAAADALLADLIALLRAMLPGGAATSSSVAREFAVVDAWLRVSRASGSVLPEVRLRVADDAAAGQLAPMLALPLLRAVIDVPAAAQSAWELFADAAGGRMLVGVKPRGDRSSHAAAVLASADVAPLRERLAVLHGDDARLWLSHTPPTIALDLPFVVEDGDAADQGA